MSEPLGSPESRRFFGVPLPDWYWILALGLIRVLIGLRYGLGVDEAHYALYGVHLDWSYFDHPPLVGWIQALFLHLFGHHDWAVHLPAEILAIVSALFVFRICEALTNNQTAARWGAIALSVSFLPNGLWFMLVPDTLLLVLVFWLCEAVLRLRASGYQGWRRWSEFGLSLGFCGLAKYTAIILMPGLLIFLLWDLRNSRSPSSQQVKFGRDQAKGLTLAVVLAAIVVSPVFYWNATHNWISFHYQILHVVHAHHLTAVQCLKNLWAFWGVQIVAYSPFVIGAALVGWWGYFRVATNAALARLILSLALPCLAFFAYTGAREAGLPHWTFFAWGLFLPAGVALAVAFGSQQRLKIAKSLVVISSVVVAILFFELAFHVIHYPPYRSAYNDFAGWKALRPTIKKLVAEKSDVAIGVPNWTLGSRANWYYSNLAPVFVLDNQFDQFDLWEGHPPIGKNILVLEWRGFAMKAAQKSKCASIDPIGVKIFSEHHVPVTSVKLWWCNDFHE